MKKNKSRWTLALLVGISTLFGGCASSGLTVSSHLTNVQLGNPNFKVIATSITGEGSSRALLGISVGLGFGTSQLALIPLDKNRLLYGTAMKTLWANFETAHGPVANRRLALINMRYDSDALNLFFYTKLTTVLVADVVEFE
ncbi:MAG TPA: DUF6567 family protein [Chryseosolibacter sp.]